MSPTAADWTSTPQSSRSASASRSSRRRCRSGDASSTPLSVGVTRAINIVTTAAELELAMVNRVAARRRIDQPTVRPDGTAPNRAHLSDAEIRASALYGPPDEVAVMMQTLRAAGAEYVLLNSAGGR